MKGLLQRVRGARVEVAGEIVGAVDQGLLVLVAVEPEDTRASADKLLHKLLNYRVFSDAEGKMNLSLADVGGGLTEHELVEVYVAQAPLDLPLALNPDEVEAAQWVDLDRLIADVAATPQAYSAWLAIYLRDHARRIFGMLPSG